jgi:putative ABC transport system substrate-binding protein
MRRRELVGLIGVVTAWPLTASAQRPGKMPTIGFLSPNSSVAAKPWTAAFVQRLSDLGWDEGRNVHIEYRWQDGQAERAVQFVDELVRLKVDVILTHGVSAIVAAKQASSTIPTVFALATDPVGSGWVESLSRPGGNVTGLSIQARDLSGKRLELLREILPGLRRLGVIGDSSGNLEMKEVEAVALQIGLESIAVHIRQGEEIAPAIAALMGRVDALYVCSTPLINTNRLGINDSALAAKLPTMHGYREAVVSGGLVSYGPNFPDLFRRSANFVDKILRGAKPRDIPVEQPTKFDLVFNLKTAKALDLGVPQTLLARADEVVE